VEFVINKKTLSFTAKQYKPIHNKPKGIFLICCYSGL